MPVSSIFLLRRRRAAIADVPDGNYSAAAAASFSQIAALKYRENSLLRSFHG